MNKIFKVVWSKSKECYVVVSEVAKNNGGKKKALASVLAGLAMVGAIGVGQVSAYSAGGGSDTGSNSVAIGPSAVASGANGVAVGRANQATATSSVAVGVNNKAQADDSSAVGSSNTIASGATQASAFGRENTVNRGGTIAAGYKNTTNGDRNVAIGNENTTTGEETIGIGTKVIAGTGKTIAIGNVYNPGGGVEKQTIARGNDTINPATGQVNNIFALAIGNGAQADGKAKSASGMIAIGQDVLADSNNSIAMGVEAKATAAQSIAFGKAANASGSGAFALGQATNASGHGSIAMGNGVQSTGIGSTGIGRTAKATSNGAVALGFSAEATADQAIAIGGDGKGVVQDAATNQYAGLGEKTTATAKNAVAVGHKATANIEGGVALGSESKTTKDAGEIGYNPATGRTNDYKNLTNNTKAALTSTRAAVSIGDDSAGVTRQLTGLAAGTQDTDAVNVAQLKAVNLKYAGDTGNSDVLLKDGTLNVKGDTNLISTSADATGITVTAKVGGAITANNDGKAVAPTTNGIATTTNVTDAINNSGWKANASANGGTLTGSATATKVVPGDTVTFSAGKNLTVAQTLGTNTQQYTYALSSTLKDIESIQNGTTKITLNNGGGTTISGGNLSVDGNKITNVAPGTDDTDAVNYSQIKGLRTEVKAGTGVTVTPSKGTDGHDIYTVSANAIGGTASTESVVKKADAAGDKNIADVSVAGGKNVNDPGAQYEVSVSKNAVKDAAREAVTVNNGGNTDNPITVTPTDDATNHNTTYAVTFDGNKAAKQIPLTYKANGSGDKTVTLDKGLNFTNGTNTTAAIDNDGVVKFNLNDNVTLTNAGSLTVGDTKVNNDGLTITGGPSVTKNGIDAGSQKITNVAPGTISSTSTDAVNGSQLYAVDQKFNNTVKLTGNAGATDGQALNKANGLSFGVIGADNGKYISTSANGSDVTVDLSTDAKKLLNNTVEVKGTNAATVTSTTVATADGGTKTIYTVDVASTGAVAKSSWNVKSSADTANGGAEATGHEAAAKNIADTNTVEMVAGKNLTVKQTSETDGAKVEFALNKDLKDLTSVTTEKVATKEIGLQDAAGNTTTIKKDGDRITYTNDGGTTVNKVANLADEKHIAPGSYAVQNDGSVTMTYVDGNGDPVANEEAKITGIAKQDLSNITDAGKKVITGLGTVVKAGDNVTVTEAADATTGRTTYTVNAVTPAVYTKADGTKVVKRPDGTYTTNIDGSAGNDVPASDVIVSFQDAAGNTTGGNSIVNNVGSAIDKTGTSTGDTFLTKLDTAATDTPNAAVNVKDLKNTSDAIIGKGLRFDANDGGEKTNKLGSKVTVQGEGTKANTEYSGTNIKTIIAQTGDDTTIDVKLAKDLTGINSISNTTTGPKMEFGGNSINITGGNLDLGGSKITNLGPATSGSDAVNYDQLKNSRTVVTSSDNSVTVTPTTSGDKTTYDLKVATTGTVAKSSWNIASDKVSATEGTVDAASQAAQNIADTKTVTMQAGKNLTVKQTNDNGNASVAFALDKDLKDLTSVTTDKVTTKEIGLQDAAGNTTTIKKDGDRITYTNDGGTTVNKVANLADEKHIAPGSYAVQNDGSVTMTYVDGNGDPVANEEAKITGIAKQDLSNITDAGKNVITGLGTVVKAGDNVTVSEAADATTGQKTYTVNAVTPAVYTKADGTKVVKRPDGTYTTNIDGSAGNDVPASDVIVSFQDAAGNTTGGNSIVNNVGSAIDKTGTSTGDTFLTKLDTAATDTPNAAVNVKDLKNTSDAIIGKGLRFDANDGGEKTNKLGSKVTVQGEGTKANTEYSGTNIKTIIAQTGDDTTIDVKLAKDLTGINSISNTTTGPKMEFGGNSINITGGNLDLGGSKITNLGPATSGSDAVNYDQLKNSRTVVTSSDNSVTVTPTTSGDKTTYDLKVATTGTVAKSSWNIASDKVSATEGTVDAASQAAQNIADTKTVTMQAGKNLTVKQTNDNGNASVAFALDKDLKDLTSVTTEKITTKEIGLQDPHGATATIKYDDNRITYTNDGGATEYKVANLNDEKHITQGEYTVGDKTIDPNAADDEVTMTYTSGYDTVINGPDQKPITTKIKGIAKSDLSNITDAGKKVITGLGTVVKAGDNVTVSEASDATTGQKTYTVNAVTPAVYTKADGTKVVKRPDGTYTTNIDGSAGNDVPASDVIVSFQDAAGNTTGGNSIVNNVGSAIDKTGTSTGDTFLTKLDTAATDTPNAAVNVKDLKNTSDAIIGKGLRFDANDGGEKTNKLGSKVTVQGEGTKANTEYSGTNIKTIIAQTGDDTTIDVKLAKDLTGINSISNTAGGPTMTFGGNSINITGGNLDLGGSKITNLAPGTDDTDAVNYKQLKAAKTVVKGGSNVTVNKTTGANGEDVYTVNATGGTGGAASTWNLNTGAVSTTEGTHTGDTTQNIADTKTVTMQAGKNLTVKQTNDTNGNTEVAFALDKDLKDLTSVTTDKVTTKEIGLQDAAGNTTTIKKDGDRITYTNDGGTTTKTVATLDDEMHIKDKTYTVDGNKQVTLTYVDGNNKDVAGKKAIIDLSGLDVGDKDTDMRIKEGNYTATNGSVTLNTVDKDGTPVTGKDVVIKGINTNNYQAGDNVTFTNNGTDANGNPIVKINAEVSTEQVKAKAGNDNLATVAPATGSTQGGKNATYEVNVDKTNLENKAEISYKANGGTAQKTTLANGFNFTSDDNSVAITTGANGKVNFKVDTTGIQGKAFNLDVNKEGTGKVENAQTAAATPSVEKGTKFVAGNNLSIRHDGINGDANYDHQVTYALNSDLKGITSITNNGGTTMNFGPNEISINGGNLNMGGNKITNVKNGTDKSDVATVGQLTKVTSNDNSVAINKTTDADGAPVYDLSVQGGGHDPRVDQLGEEIGRVGAQGAALAALKPIQYDPLEPTQIMAGYGNYRGNSAIAMGVAHYKNESTLMHAGVSWAGGSRHMMANAGVTWKVGNRDSEAAVADRYRKGPISSAYAMQQEMASVKAQNAGLKTEVSDLKAENEQMKAQIAAMMAKLGM